MGTGVEQFGVGFLFGTPHRNGLPAYDCCHARIGVVHVAHQDRLCRAHHHAGRLQVHVNPMRTKITLLGRVVFGIDKDGIVRTGCNTGFAANTDGFVEIHNAVRPGVHGRGRTGVGAGCVLTLIAAGDLKSPSRVWEGAHVGIFHIGAIDRKRNVVL